MSHVSPRAGLSAAILLAATLPASVQAEEVANADQLAKQLANPVASLISVPFQLNWDTGMGPNGDGDKYTLNIQPVIPIALNDKWNLISRTILPAISQDDVIPGAGSQSGFGDITQSFFFSPKDPTSSGWIWGAGPVFLLPTGGNDFSADQWGAGPTAVVLKQTSTGWTYGMLANQIWGFSNDGKLPDVNSMFLQPFVAKGLGKGRTITLNTESTYNWDASQWTVPINLMASQVLPIGKQLVSIGIGARGYVEKPDGGPDWGLRLVVTLLYPR